MRWSALTAIRIRHHASPRRVSHVAATTFARRQSRITVSAETFRTDAVSSTLSRRKTEVRRRGFSARRTSPAPPARRRAPRNPDVGSSVTTSASSKVTFYIAAALLVSPRARVVDKDVAHDAGGHCEEMCAVLPCDVLCVHPPQIRLVHKRGGLQTVPNALVTHVLPRDTMEFVVDERSQLLERLFVALPPFQQQSGNFRGTVRNTAILSPILLQLWNTAA